MKRRKVSRLIRVPTKGMSLKEKRLAWHLVCAGHAFFLDDWSMLLVEPKAWSKRACV